MTVEAERRLAFGVPESEDDPPQPRVFRLRVGDDFVVAFAGGVVEYEIRGSLQHVGVAIGLAKGRALELGEIPEPSDALGADRFVASVDDEVGGLVIVAVK